MVPFVLILALLVVSGGHVIAQDNAIVTAKVSSDEVNSNESDKKKSANNVQAKIDNVQQDTDVDKELDTGSKSASNIVSDDKSSKLEGKDGEQDAQEAPQNTSLDDEQKGESSEEDDSERGINESDVQEDKKQERAEEQQTDNTLSEQDSEEDDVSDTQTGDAKSSSVNESGSAEIDKKQDDKAGSDKQPNGPEDLKDTVQDAQDFAQALGIDSSESSATSGENEKNEEPLKEAKSNEVSSTHKEEDDQEEENIDSPIDTIDLDEGGNWLLKRKALEDTAEVIEKINNVFVKVIDSGTKYRIIRNKLDSDLDNLINQLGFDLGELDQVLAEMLEDLEKERAEDGDLSPAERDILYRVNNKKQDVKKLKEALQLLIGLEQNLDNVLAAVDTQTKIANNYQVQAWKNFQEIKQVLNDEKAEDLYYRTEGLYQSLEDIWSYLSDKLMSYFKEQESMLREHMEDVRSKVHELSQNGILLKKDLGKAEREEVQEKEMPKVDVQKGTQGIWSTITYVITSPFRLLYNIINYVGSFFISSSTTNKAKVASNSESVEGQRVIEKTLDNATAEIAKSV